MFLLIKKMILSMCVVSILTSCSSDKNNLLELCQKIPKPVQENFDEATIYQMQQAYDKLIKTCRKDNSLKSIVASKIVKLAKIYLVNDLNKSSFEAMEIAIQILPKQFAWYYFSGIALERLGKFNEAIQQFDMALKLRPQNIPTLIRMIEIYNTLNEESQANHFLSMLLDIDKNQPIALFLKAQALISNGKGREAESILIKLIKKHPKATKLNYLLSNALRLQGKNSEAKNILKNAGNKSLVLDDPLFKELQQLVTGAGAHMVLANKARKNGNIKVAMSHLLTALEFEPKNTSALHNLGYLFGVQGNHEKALEYLTKAFNLSPENIDLASDYATALVATKHYPKAVTIYKNILEITPRDDEIRKKLNKLLEFMKTQTN